MHWSIFPCQVLVFYEILFFIQKKEKMNVPSMVNTQLLKVNNKIKFTMLASFFIKKTQQFDMGPVAKTQEAIFYNMRTNTLRCMYKKQTVKHKEQEIKRFYRQITGLIIGKRITLLDET